MKSIKTFSIRLSDILTVNGNEIQPVPEISATFDTSFSEGIIISDEGMICFLNLTQMFDEADMDGLAALDENSNVRPDGPDITVLVLLLVPFPLRSDWALPTPTSSAHSGSG